MIATATPNPFDPQVGFTIEVESGTPPFTFKALPAPPNPPGVRVVPAGPTAQVTVPPGTPSGTSVQVEVVESSVPPNRMIVSSTVA